MHSNLTTTEQQYDAARCNALDLAEQHFNLLVTGPAPLSLDGSLIGHGLPARDIDLRELRAILLHPATDLSARDAAWRELVSRSRSDGPAWTIGCVGVAMPGLKQITARLLRGLPAAHAEDVISSLLTAFVAGLASIDLERHSIAPRLLWAAKRAAVKTCRQEATCVPVTAETLSMIAPRPVGGHEDLVLADAVRQGVITAEEAELIGVTRLEKIPLSVFARERGEVPRRLYDRRERAEKRLVAAIQEGKVTANSAGLDRNPGW